MNIDILLRHDLVVAFLAAHPTLESPVRRLLHRALHMLTLQPLTLRAILGKRHWDCLEPIQRAALSALAHDMTAAGILPLTPDDARGRLYSANAAALATLQLHAQHESRPLDATFVAERTGLPVVRGNNYFLLASHGRQNI